MTLTKRQRQFLEAVADGRNESFHRRVVQPMFDAGCVFPRPGNMFFWIVGCMGHNAASFFLLADGATALGWSPVGREG